MCARRLIFFDRAITDLPLSDWVPMMFCNVCQHIFAISYFNLLFIQFLFKFILPLLLVTNSGRIENMKRLNCYYFLSQLCL